MRNTLILLSSLALASAASAQSTSITSSSLIASYSTTGAAAFDSYTSFQYDHVNNGNFNNSTSFDDDGGRLAYELTGSTSHSHVDGTSLFAMGSQATVAIDAPDYNAITPGADPYALSYVGYTYVLKFVVGSAGGSVSFDLHAAQTLIGSAASPSGLQQYDPVAGTFSGGAYARGAAGGGVIDVTTGFDNNSAQDGDYASSFESTAREDTTFVATPTYEVLNSGTFSTTFTFDTAGTRYLRLYASGHAEADYYQPVPEPASLAALTLGAAGLLRRRRKA